MCIFAVHVGHNVQQFSCLSKRGFLVLLHHQQQAGRHVGDTDTSLDWWQPDGVHCGQPGSAPQHTWRPNSHFRVAPSSRRFRGSSPSIICCMFGERCLAAWIMSSSVTVRPAQAKQTSCSLAKLCAAYVSGSACMDLGPVQEVPVATRRTCVDHCFN